MIVLAWSLFVVVSLLVATNQAFLAAPLPVHGVSTYDLTSIDRQAKENEVIHKTNDNHEKSSGPTARVRSNEDQTVYVIEFESESNEKDDKDKNSSKDSRNGKFDLPGSSEVQNPLDPWSIVWYIGSFGGLVAFFLIVSCSEWCCRRGGRTLAVPYSQRADVMNGTTTVTETPPPPYHLFAPPPYDSVNYGDIVDKTSGEKLDIYVISVPIHRPMVQAPA